MIKDTNIKIRHVKKSDKLFWFTLDKHLPLNEFNKKVKNRQGYVILQNGAPVGILRYNLFWDNTPFCNLIYIKKDFQKKGFGKKLLTYWENEMQLSGYNLVLVSTQANENAQHFYRYLGYFDCGSLNFPNQPKELFFYKRLST